jgi:hypothetical protein
MSLFVVTLIVGAVVALNFTAPSVSRQLLWIAALCSVFPIVAYAAGTLVWFVLNLVSGWTYDDAVTWLWCCTCAGLPSATVAAAALRLNPPRD